MFCPSCGTRCPDNAIACHSCGAVLPGLTETLGGVSDSALSPETHRHGGGDGRTMLAEEDSNPIGEAYAISAGRPVRVESPASPSQRMPDPADTPVGAARIGQVKLVVEQGRILGEQFLLNDYEVIIGRYDAGSGRCPDIDLTAQDPAYVHRQHVRLAFNRTGDQLMIYDMGGRNGSYINNQLIEKNGSALVQVGDKIRVGRVVLRVQAARDVEDDRNPR